jgi:DNA replication protein DnaC
MTQFNQKIMTPPHSKESEMMVLGCMLTSDNSLSLAAEMLDERDFYYSEHKIIFQSLKRAYNNDEYADVHLIAEDLKRQNKLNSVGSVFYLTTLAQYAGTSSYIEEYIDVIKNKALLRQIIDAAQEAKHTALSDPRDPTVCLHALQDKLNRLEKQGRTKKSIDIRFLNQFEKDFLLVEPQKKPMLLEYSPLDGISKDFLPKGIVAMLVGAGGVGKTHLLMQLAISVASGTPFLNVCRTTEHCGNGGKGNVFIGLGENQYDDIHRIIFKASKKIRENSQASDYLAKEISNNIAVFSFCGEQAAFIENGKPSKYFREFKMGLIENAPATGWSLIILDPVSRLLGIDAEIHNASATQFIALMEELTLDLPGNPTVLFAHHVNKASLAKPEDQSQASARGASGITDGVRWQANFFKSDKEQAEITVLKMTKSNFTAIIEDICTKKDFHGYIEHTKEEKKSKTHSKRSNTFVDYACRDIE